MCDEVFRDVELLLPKGWHSSVRNAVLNVIGIVRIAMLAGREALINADDVKAARIHQLESEVAMLREELRINGSRMQRVAPHRRPQYTTVERMAILQLRAMRGWNKAETGRHFFVSDDTIRAWLRRADDIQHRTSNGRVPVPGKSQCLGIFFADSGRHGGSGNHPPYQVGNGKVRRN